MRIFIIRHGETDWNIEKRLQGISDIPLNQTGLEQSQKIANRLRLEKIDVIITSPLQRAKHTAQAIAKYHTKAKFIEEIALQELGFGEVEGYTWPEVWEKYPDYYFKPTTPQELFLHKTPGGESIEDGVQRLIPKVETWKKEYKDKTIVLVTHGRTKRALLIAFKVATYEEIHLMQIQNTGLTIIKPFDIDNIELLNDVSHLSDDTTQG